LNTRTLRKEKENHAWGGRVHRKAQRGFYRWKKIRGSSGVDEKPQEIK